MSGVTLMLGLLEKLESSKLRVNPGRCVLVRNRNATCARCAEVCTSDCITISDNELHIDPSECIGCGTCTTACPTAAIEAQNPTDAELITKAHAAAEKTNGRIVFACDVIMDAARGRVDPERVTNVVCLGRLNESILIDLAANATHPITLVHGACETCPHNSGFTTVESVCDGAQELLEAWDIPATIEIKQAFPSATKLEADTYDHDRRAFLTDIRGNTKHAARSAAEYAAEELDAKPSKNPAYEKVTDEGTLPQYIPERHQAILDTLNRTGDAHDCVVSSRIWGRVWIDSDLCTSCRMCATFCPTGALRRFVDGELSGISHAPALCVQCRTCESICPAHAITVDGLVTSEELNGEAVRFEMESPAHPSGTPHGTMYRMRELIGSKRVADF